MVLRALLTHGRGGGSDRWRRYGRHRVAGVVAEALAAPDGRGNYLAHKRPLRQVPAR